jgi:beta-galactosidase
VEPQDGMFDITHVDRKLNAMYKAGIRVILGTPNGSRQNMDISNKDFRFYAERVIEEQ